MPSSLFPARVARLTCQSELHTLCSSFFRRRQHASSCAAAGKFSASRQVGRPRRRSRAPRPSLVVAAFTEDSFRYDAPCAAAAATSSCGSKAAGLLLSLESFSRGRAAGAPRHPPWPRHCPAPTGRRSSRRGLSPNPSKPPCLSCGPQASAPACQVRASRWEHFLFRRCRRLAGQASSPFDPSFPASRKTGVFVPTRERARLRGCGCGCRL